MNSERQTLNVGQIMDFLPHRYPFLLVDRVVDLVPGKSIQAYKNVTINEAFFQGHFPGLPVMPGVLIMEALAQAGGLMVLSEFTSEERAGKIFLFTSMDNVRFRRPVHPGDRLDLQCTLLRNKFRLWKMGTKAYVDGQLVSEGEISAAMAERGEM